LWWFEARSCKPTPRGLPSSLVKHRALRMPPFSGSVRSGHTVMPNHSVNLTRNSVPRLPGSARYAHNALPGKRFTLPRAGYLKR
jgi:hypothetical protein